jgi:hypothetical protein
LKVIIDKEFPLAQAKAAHEYFHFPHLVHTQPRRIVMGKQQALLLKLQQKNSKLNVTAVCGVEENTEQKG